MGKRGKGYTNVPDGLLDDGLPSQVGATAYVVYLEYRRLRSKEGAAYPSLTYLQRATGFARPSVSKAVRTLRDSGWLRCDHKGRSTGDPSIYYVALIETGELVKDLNQLSILTSKESDAELVKDLNPTITSTPLQRTLVDAADEEIDSTSSDNEDDPSPSKKRTAKRFRYEKCDEDVVEFIQKVTRKLYRADWMLSNIPKSCNEIRMMRVVGAGCEKHGTIGPVSVERIHTALKWLKDVDDFWFESGNMRSGKALRDAFPVIEDKMNATKRAPQQPEPVDEFAEARRARRK